MNHRIPFQRITHLTIDGDVMVNEIRMRGGGYNSAPGYAVPPYPPNAAPYGTGAYPSGPGYANNYVQVFEFNRK